MLADLKRDDVRRPRHSAADSGGDHNRSIVGETVPVAGEHHGLARRSLVVGRQRPAADPMAGCSGLTIARAELTETLSQSEGRLIANAVMKGLGLVSPDWDLRDQDIDKGVERSYAAAPALGGFAELEA